MDKSDGQQKYGHLNQLSTAYLEEILRTDMESSEGGDEDMILYILEVIEKREKSSDEDVDCDIDKAWEEFQKYYMDLEAPLYPMTMSDCDSGPDGGNAVSISPRGSTDTKQRPSAAHKPSRTFLKRMILVAAIISVLLAGMITAQAFGMDVFGALARWTDETFRFISPTGECVALGAEVEPEEPDSNTQELREAFQAALREGGIPESLAPGWFPDGCVMTREPKIVPSAYSSRVYCEYRIPPEKILVFSVQKYSSSVLPELLGTEKDASEVEHYITNDKLFYIMSNNECFNAAWSDSKFLSIKVSGNIPIEAIKQLLDSIGE